MQKDLSKLVPDMVRLDGGPETITADLTFLSPVSFVNISNVGVVNSVNLDLLISDAVDLTSDQTVSGNNLKTVHTVAIK